MFAQKALHLCLNSELICAQENIFYLKVKRTSLLIRALDEIVSLVCNAYFPFLSGSLSTQDIFFYSSSFDHLIFFPGFFFLERKLLLA